MRPEYNNRRITIELSHSLYIESRDMVKLFEALPEGTRLLGIEQFSNNTLVLSFFGPAFDKVSDCVEAPKFEVRFTSKHDNCYLDGFYDQYGHPAIWSMPPTPIESQKMPEGWLTVQQVRSRWTSYTPQIKNLPKDSGGISLPKGLMVDYSKLEPRVAAWETDKASNKECGCKYDGWKFHTKDCVNKGPV